MKRFIVLVMATALLAGCARFGGGSGTDRTNPPASPTPTPAATDELVRPTGSDELVLRLEYVGGFVPVEWTRTTVPTLSIYGDGTVITVGPTTLEYPGKALPNLQMAQISNEQLDELIASAQAADLLEGERDLPLQPLTIADASTTVLTIVADGQVHRTSAYALMEIGEEGERAALRDFIAAELDELMLTGSEPYDFEAMRVWASPARAEMIDDEFASEADWPLDNDLAEFGEPSNFGAADEDALRCGVVSGPELETLVNIIESEANALTQWRSGDELYSVQLRPLLPDEEGCPQVEM